MKNNCSHLSHKYGFSKQFIDTVKLLYNDIRPDILVNGYRTAAIKIGRCVKQGDALSCALFIICLDPLIRNIEKNRKIKAVELRTPMSNETIVSKTGAFADDVGTVTINDPESINEIFIEYRNFSLRSGILLNELKTEILLLKKPDPIFASINFEITLPDRCFSVKSVQSITICGVTHSNYPAISYENNVSAKIYKLKKRLLAWQYRGISLGGKVLVVNTFGISQLIYTMQVCEYYEQDLLEIERFIFGFLWSKNINISIAPDRIKRDIMKQDYENGGLRVPDLKAINSALKLRQFFQASTSNHTIKTIQKYTLESLGYNYVINQEYSKISKSDTVIKASQNTINSLTDKWRVEITQEQDLQKETIDLIASTGIKEFLLRKEQLLANCLFQRLLRSGIENYKQLVMEKAYPRSDAFAKIAAVVIKAFPANWEILILKNIECNSSIDVRQNVVLGHRVIFPVSLCKVKNIRLRLVRNNQITPKYETVLGIIPHENINPFLVARQVNFATSQKIFKFRLLHLDIFTKQRMFKFKMTNSDQCDICGEVETLKHAIWDCRRARVAWGTFDNILTALGLPITISFNTLFIGLNPTNGKIETMITKLTQTLLSFDRSTMLSEHSIRNTLYSYAILNSYKKNNKKEDKDPTTWEIIKQGIKPRV